VGEGKVKTSLRKLLEAQMASRRASFLLLLPLSHYKRLEVKEDF